MKKVRKSLALMLATVMVIGIAACGGGSSQQKDGSNEGEEGKEITLAEVKPTIKVLQGSSSLDLNATVEAGVIEAATGYKAEYNTLPASNATQTLMLTMANKNDYDLVVVGRSNFATLKSNGVLLALNDYIDAIAPQLWDCIPEEAWKGVSDDEGNVYALPKLYSVDTEVASFMTVRMDLCEAAGITKLPTTISGFKDMLKKLKAYYGNQYIILTGPYNKGTVGNSTTIPMCIASAFGIYNDWMVDDDGNIIYMTEHENFAEMISFMRELYDDGILDVDYAANGSSSVDEKFASGKAIIEINSRETIVEVYASLKEKGVSVDDLGWISALHGDDGTCTYMETAQYATFSCIPALHADNAADTINWIAKKVENQELISIGEEGVHFTWGEDGYPSPIQPKFTDERANANNYMNFADMETFKVQFTARLRKSDVMWKAYTECTIKANENEPDIFVKAYFAYTDSTAYSENNSVLLNNLNNYISQLIVGVKDLDSSLDTFMSDWRNNDGETVRSELTKWYNDNF